MAGAPDTALTAAERDSFFTWHPDPWEAVARLEYGGDRTFAHIIENEVLTTPPAAHKPLEMSLIALLEAPGVRRAGKEFACRMLAIAGSDACVPSVTPLLRKPETEHPARIALESIGTPAALAAIRENAPAPKTK